MTSSLPRQSVVKRTLKAIGDTIRDARLNDSASKDDEEVLAWVKFLIHNCDNEAPAISIKS